MNNQPTKVKCNQCEAEFEAELLHANKGELHATYLRCPECGEIFPSSITDRALRKVIHDYPGRAFASHKQRRSAQLKKQHGKSLKAMDGWTEERSRQ